MNPCLTGIKNLFTQAQRWPGNVVQSNDNGTLTNKVSTLEKILTVQSDCNGLKEAQEQNQKPKISR